MATSNRIRDFKHSTTPLKQQQQVEFFSAIICTKSRCEANNLFSDDPIFCRPDSLLHLCQRDTRTGGRTFVSVACSEQDFHKELRVYLRTITMESNRVHHILPVRSESMAHVAEQNDEGLGGISCFAHHRLLPSASWLARRTKDT